MQYIISLVFLVTNTQSKESWLDEYDMDNFEQSQLNQLQDRRVSQSQQIDDNDIVDLDAEEDGNENWGHLYDNANDFYSDGDEVEYDDHDYGQDEYYDDDQEDAYYDDSDALYDYYSDYYKTMNWMNQYFDEMDEFYYNSYRLHTGYDNFENIDFSKVLQQNFDAEGDDDDSYIHQLLSSLDKNEFADLAKLRTIAQKHLKTSPWTESHAKSGSFVKKKPQKHHGNMVIMEMSKNNIVITMILRSYMMYLRTAAHLRGKMKGTKGLKPLPSDLQTLCKGDFGTLDVNQIRVAMGVNTLHGDPVTFGCDIFFPRQLDLQNNESDLQMLLTQMKYAQMYTEEGGIWPFLEKHVMNVCDDHNDCNIFQKIVRQRSLNLMDIVRLDKMTRNALKMEMNKIWHQYGSLVRQTDAFLNENVHQMQDKPNIVPKKVKVRAVRKRQP